MKIALYARYSSDNQRRSAKQRNTVTVIRSAQVSGDPQHPIPAK